MILLFYSMQKRTSYEIKEHILRCVKEKSYSYAQLERKINTGFRTVKSNCRELQEYGLVKIQTMKEHPSNNKLFYIISITERGIEFLQSKKNTH